MSIPEATKGKLSKGRVITLLGIGIVLIIAISIGIISSDNDELSQSAIVAKEYLEEKGYNVVYYRGAGDNYLLTESLVRRLPEKLYWEVQDVDLSNYFGKYTHRENFYVDNHRLNKDGNTRVSVNVVDEEVIGANAFVDFHGGAGDSTIRSLD